MNGRIIKMGKIWFILYFFRAKEVELELLDSKEMLRRLENDYQNILRSVAVEIDSLIEVVAMDSHDTYKVSLYDSNVVVMSKTNTSYNSLGVICTGITGSK